MNPFLRFRMLFVITALIGALNTVTSSRSDGGEEDYSIPEDVCRLEITLPPSSAVTLDGKNYGVKPTTKRSFRFRNLERETLRKVAVNVRFRDGKTVDRVILAQGGDLVRLVLVDPNVARPELVLQTGHTSTVTSVAFSPDGKQVLTGSGDKTAILWEAVSGEKLRSFEGHTSIVNSVAFSPDGKHVLTGSSDHTAILWDAASGENFRSFEGHTSTVTSVAFSPDGKQVLTGSWDTTAILWAAVSGEKLLCFEGHTGSPLESNADGLPYPSADDVGDVRSVAFSSDGKQALTGSGDKTAILWDAATGQELRRFEGHTGRVNSVAFSPDGRQVLTGSADDTARLWDAASGEKLRSFEGHNDIESVAFSPDGKQVLTGFWDKTAILWDSVSGEKLRSFEGLTYGVSPVAFSPDGKQVLTGSGDTAILWDAAVGHKLRSFEGHKSAVRSTVFSPAGTYLLTGFSEHTAILWDAVSGEKLRSFEGHTDDIESVAFAPDGKKVLTGSHRTAILWDAVSGEKLRSFEGHTDDIESVAFAPDGKQVLTGGILWDAVSGEKLRSFEGHTYDDVSSVAFSPDGKQVLTGSGDKAILWGAASGEKIWSFEGHNFWVTSVAFSPDGKQVLTGSVDGTVRLWDVLTGDELVRILSLDRGEEWLVVTPDGLFDGSPGGRQRVSFRIGQGLNVVPVDRFRNDFYWPGLLGEICRGERPMPDVDIGASLPPLLRIVSPQSGNSEEREIEVVVEATDQGGGVSDVRLFHNIGFAGRAILREERFNGSLRQTYRVDLVEGPNTIRVTAFSRDRSWEAEPAEVHLRYEKPLPASELYVLCVGVDRYEDPDLNLRFASGDAKAMADLFGGERTRSLHAQAHVTRLLNDQATKEAILDALEDMADATREQDTLIVLLAGHGEVVGDCYYFVPHDFRPHAGKVADDVKRQGVMDEEIFERLGNAPARKRILMLATCHAGAALQLPYKKRRGMADRRRQERLVRSYGVYSLAAASAEKQAHESDAIRHGVFAYTLLAGLNAVDRGPLAGQPIHPADPGGIVDVSEWVSYLARNMPEVSQELFGFRQYPVHIGEGSFPLLPLED